MGGGYARTGQAYALFKTWCINSSQVGREVLGIELLELLHEGVTYRVEFYLSMQDSIWYASKNVGAYFSAQQPDNDIDSIENYQPQVQYSGDFITDKEGWTRVSGSFVAQGGERFLSIGNFDKYEDTETLFVPGGGVNPWHSDVYWSCSAYFIDDVSVMPDSITAVGEVVGEERSYILYPNLNSGSFTIQTELDEMDASTLEVWTVSGQQVYSTTLTNGLNTVTLNVAQGLYLYRIMLNGTPKWTGKISVSPY
jgi:hypothetical protein